jgi:alcohol dehydrogenase
VVETGSGVLNWKTGDRVTLPFVCGCGTCTYCREGNPQVCDAQFQPGFTHWGSFAPYVAIHYADSNLVRLPDNLDFETSCILGCRFATAFRAVVHQGGVQPGQWVAIHGCGGVGLSAIMIARAYDARVIAVDLDSFKLQLASELGADCIVQVPNQHPVQSIKEITGNGAHISIDAVGNVQIIRNSIACLRKGGRHLQVGLVNPEEKEVPVPFDMLIAGELQLLGSHGMQASRYDAIFQLIEQGRLDPARLITRRISLGESLQELVNLDQKKDPGITVITDFTG